MQKTVDLTKIARRLDELSIVVRDNKMGRISDKETLECLRFLIETDIRLLKEDLWNWLA